MLLDMYLAQFLYTFHYFAFGLNIDVIIIVVYVTNIDRLFWFRYPTGHWRLSKNEQVPTSRTSCRWADRIETLWSLHRNSAAVT